MPSASLTIGGDIGGIVMNSSLNRTADGQIGHQVTLNEAQTATLTVRTNHTTGTMMVEEGHPIQTGDIIDVYWAGGRRYNVVAGTVDVRMVPISVGAGDNLPEQDTDLTTVEQQTIDTDFDGDLLEAIGTLCGERAHLGFYATGDALELSLDLAAGEMWHWFSGGTETNPLATDDVIYVKASQAGSDSTDTLKIGILYDSA